MQLCPNPKNVIKLLFSNKFFNSVFGQSGHHLQSKRIHKWKFKIVSWSCSLHLTRNKWKPFNKNALREIFVLKRKATTKCIFPSIHVLTRSWWNISFPYWTQYRSKSTLKRQKIDGRVGITKITYFQQPLYNLRDLFCSFKDYDIGPGLASGKTWSTHNWIEDWRRGFVSSSHFFLSTVIFWIPASKDDSVRLIMSDSAFR